MNLEIQASLDTIRNMLQYHRNKAVNPQSIYAVEEVCPKQIRVHHPPSI